MSKESQNVKEWRVRTKQRIVESMGGKCSICNYQRCQSALELHHLDPQSKLFALGQLRANPRSWKTIVNELRKCVLLCANCHREVEAGLVTIENKHYFNEWFSDESYFERKQNHSYKQKECTFCGQLFIPSSGRQKKCNPLCRKLKIIWPSIEELIVQVKNSNFTVVAKLLGVSDNGLRKFFTKHGVNPKDVKSSTFGV